MKNIHYLVPVKVKIILIFDTPIKIIELGLNSHSFVGRFVGEYERSRVQNLVKYTD